MKKVVDESDQEQDGEKIPSIVFTKGSAPWVTDIASIGANAMEVLIGQQA